MVVAIYYFLHQAGIRMKLFAFAIYTCGMLAYLGMMLLESNVGVGALEALRAIPPAAQSLPTQHYLSVRASWVGVTASLLLNLIFCVLWLGTGYLLFFWRKPAEIAAPGTDGACSVIVNGWPPRRRGLSPGDSRLLLPDIGVEGPRF